MSNRYMVCWVMRWPSHAIVTVNSISKRCAKIKDRGGFEITEGATGSLSVPL
jgi:hypothetical protein